MPIGGNILTPEGLGPLTLRDTYILNLPDVSPLPWPFWALATGLALYGQFVLIKRVADYLIGVWDRRDVNAISGRDAPPLMAVVTTAAYCAPILLIGVYDRYVTPLFPLIFFWLLATGKPNLRNVPAFALGGATLLATVIFAILGTHDYMAWNRARWDAIAELERSHTADAHNLDGGFEYNALRSFDLKYIPPASKSWWWVNDDAYLIAFAPIEGYAPYARYSYERYLMPGTQDVYVLRKQPSGSTEKSQ